MALARNTKATNLNLKHRQSEILTQKTQKLILWELELELELIQTQMAQKPMLRAEVYAHAMRASQNRKKEVRREKKV